ncbi:helix-turn-helix and ligand-binding sensor domain-containing protein [Flavivirga rizhaonensis]|uniref:Transcriptional regulator n=1 Tax=Flavivirga rizhaonensis TaxID=2559571 RepID=A0A4V3P4P1_9FLAO|nr:transcriptional regulator [Flavivirga rizhaonensis]TGV02164.1 transcriptional regulator [Flavivirga rizhaonensis]
MQLKHYKVLFLFSFFMASHNVTAQYIPYFKNYALTEYNAGNQNWDVSKAHNGKLYVANDKGLVEFDGLKWNFYQLPNKTIIRSVLAHKNVIYTGSYEEFGYWKKNSKGKLVYTSLSNFKENETPSDEEFWQIFFHDNAILFRSFSKLYIYKNGEIKRIKPESTVLSCSVVDNRVYVSTVRNGIFILEGDILKPFINTSELVDVKIISIVNYNKGKLLITTALNGCYIYNKINNRLELWESSISNIIKEQQLNTFQTLKNGDMVFGTIKNGVYITDKSGHVKYHINKENGLLNNTVLGHELGSNNNLWVGLDNGIAEIDLDYNHTLYNDTSGKLGAVYDVISYRNTLYLGSNTGLFYLKEGDLNFIEGSQGQVWDLKEINGQLLCGHNDGTYVVENNKLRKISEFTGGWVIKKVPEMKNTFIQGTYGGLVRFDISEGKWNSRHMGNKTIPIKYLVFEDTHTAWVAHAYKGLFRVRFDKSYDSIVTFDNYKNKGLWSDFSIKVHKIKNDICFKTNRGWQKYEALIDSIVPHDLLNNSFGTDADIISESGANELVTNNANDKITFLSLTEDKKGLNLPNELIQKRLVVDAESVSQLNDSIYTLNLYDGFMLINNTAKKRSDTLHKPIIEHIEIDKTLVDINNEQVYEFPFNKSISVSISSPLSKNHFFEYAITTSDVLNWYKMDNERLELSSLSNGDYSIHFRATNLSGEVSPEKIIQITILPPWYKNSLFYLIMALIIGGVVYGLHKRKIKKEQKILHDKFVKEQEILLKEKTIENDKKIVQLKNQSLKNEVKLKSKQLANTAMALVKKNESMLEIKNELIRNKEGFDNSSTYKRLLRKIDNSIGHEDEWEIFEYNFNQVHEAFFNQLKAKHPKLTHKDLKICAYIKMNLLTKEIAPLMNVSIRGLETHRYRLKRKLNLENDKSLSEYLLDFK